MPAYQLRAFWPILESLPLIIIIIADIIDYFYYFDDDVIFRYAMRWLRCRFMVL